MVGGESEVRMHVIFNKTAEIQLCCRKMFYNAKKNEQL